MTISAYTFTLASATLSNGASSEASGSGLPARITVSSLPQTWHGVVSDDSATSHWDFNSPQGRVGCLVDATLLADHVEPAERDTEPGDSTLVGVYPGNRAIHGRSSSGAVDFATNHTSAIDYDQTNDFSIEFVGYSTTAGRVTITKFDGSVGTEGQGWVLWQGTPTNEDIQIDFTDGTNHLTVHGDAGEVVSGSANANHVVITVSGDTTITDSDIEIYHNGVKLTKTVVDSGPCGDFSNAVGLEAGYLGSGLPVLSIFDRNVVGLEHFAIYDSVLSDADVLAHYEILTGTQDKPAAQWQYTATGVVVVAGAMVPGRLGNLMTSDDSYAAQQVRVRTYWSKNDGAQTEFKEAAIPDVALAASDTFEITAVWEPSSTFDSLQMPFIGDDTGEGPVLYLEDGLVDSATEAAKTYGIKGDAFADIDGSQAEVSGGSTGDVLSDVGGGSVAKPGGGGSVE